MRHRAALKTTVGTVLPWYAVPHCSCQFGCTEEKAPPYVTGDGDWHQTARSGNATFASQMVQRSWKAPSQSSLVAGSDECVRLTVRDSGLSSISALPARTLIGTSRPTGRGRSAFTVAGGHGQYHAAGIAESCVIEGVLDKGFAAGFRFLHRNGRSARSMVSILAALSGACRASH